MGAKTEDAETEEVVCAAPDALIAHQSWVHFSINCRKVKSADHAEARLFVNGVRVGAMKTIYPTATPLAPGSAKTASPVDAIRIGVGKSLLAEEGEAVTKEAGGKEEDNEIMLGRTLLLEEPLSEDLILFFHHLVSVDLPTVQDHVLISLKGPRYHGNLQEAAGKFLTCECDLLVHYKCCQSS